MPFSELDGFRRLRDITCGGDAGAEGPAAEGPPPLPRYEIKERIGEGATSVVYRAWDRELRRLVAVKVLRTVVALSDVARERFRREARAAAALAHVNVVAVYDVGEVEGQPYLVMELVEGRSLGETLKGGPCGEAELLLLLEKAARGIAAAHEKGIVHRDLKPANILVASSGEPKVGDFGLAHLIDAKTELTRTGTALGTPLYMAPEQVEGRSGEITPRTDIYAFGAILYEAFAGRPPHQAETVMELYRKIVHDVPQSPRKINPSISAGLERIIVKSLEKDPACRYANASDLVADLGRHLRGEPVQGQPAGALRRLSWRARKNPVLATLAAVALVAVGVAGGVWISERARWRAERETRVETVRKMARVSLEASLRLRRAGDNEGMKKFLPELALAYRQAVEAAPDLAEVEYLMGRMHRALMEDEKAIECQERAVRKDPDYAPARYERAVLASKRYGRGLTGAPNTLVWVHSARPLRVLPAEEAERAHPELRKLRESVLEDCAQLELLLARRSGPSGVSMSEAHVQAARGIVACHTGRWDEARKALEAAVRDDPEMEEAWETLAEVALKEAGRASAREEKLKKWREAEAIYTEALSHDRGYLPYLWGRGKLHAQRALHFRTDELVDLEKAEKDFADAIQLEPSWARSWELRGNARAHRAFYWLHSGKDPLVDFAEAVEDFTKALSLDPKATETWIWRGISCHHSGHYRSQNGQDPLPDYASAEADFSQAIRLEGGDPDAWLERGMVRIDRALYRVEKREDPERDLNEAERDLSQSLRLNAVSAETWQWRGRTRYERAVLREAQQRSSEAREDWTGAAADFIEAIRQDSAFERIVHKRLAESQERLSRLRKN